MSGFSIPDDVTGFEPSVPVGDGGFIIPREDWIERPSDNELIVRERTDD